MTNLSYALFFAILSALSALAGAAAASCVELLQLLVDYLLSFPPT